jgi:hypothetical protein
MEQGKPVVASKVNTKWISEICRVSYTRIDVDLSPTVLGNKPRESTAAMKVERCLFIYVGVIVAGP